MISREDFDAVFLESTAFDGSDALLPDAVTGNSGMSVNSHRALSQLVSFRKSDTLQLNRSDLWDGKHWEPELQRVAG